MQKVLSLDGATAKKLYPKADEVFKAMLEENFGKAHFSEKITDRVKSFEDACQLLGITSDEVYSNFDSPDEVAYKKLKVIARALNEGWYPDWENDRQPKFYPWFLIKGGFRLDCVYEDCAGSFVGSRLCFKTRELAQYATTQFADLYKIYFTA